MNNLRSDTEFFCNLRNKEAHLSLPPTKLSAMIPALPITPPAMEADPEVERILATAVHVLSTEATALSYLSRLYATDPISRGGFVKAVEAIAASNMNDGKTIIIGVGKSGKIGEKLVATMNSLGLSASFMHPIEALHGDLGMVKPKDVLLLITFSGNTPELLSLLPHLPKHLPLIALTSHTSYHTSQVTRGRPGAILLPAPIPEPETVSFGVSAPTTSTTVALALGDALAVACARQLHNHDGNMPADVFRRNHPGGAIGLGTGKGVVRMSDLAIRLDEIPVIPCGSRALDSPPISSSSSESDLEVTEWRVAPLSVRVVDCLIAAVGSKSGWVKISLDEIIPPGRLQRVRGNVHVDVYDPDLALVVGTSETVKVSGDSSVDDIRQWIIASRDERHDPMLQDGAVLGVVVGGEVMGVVEIDELMRK
ncbi:hypothetical protein DFP73DRAFT_537815 [Morchella snyderi]|nr:hypothetical protein DFP73DRAFT_537815 [Morchella snyderi]